ncbi:uncharacterized protein N0V89_012231 [Didymosphaeria variabile]|uniref:Small ribosomal subunit protein mS29 n=1 Tax=Didymosphaeria variabile TaxID=1932322 RepID=A0A9W9C495_9PLEO|nr:uncharacterized protein N0V89_012231 [Didymosphaeria variabile]KAJ4344488.1 hypothetical protein N0V89_012231 [Didymosphaeria variabile]
MPPSICLRSFSQLSLDTTARASMASRTLVHPQIAYFSTSAARYANPVPKRKGMSAPAKKGTRTLNVKKGRSSAQDTGKRPAQGERKAARKRIVLTNDNALEVASLKDMSKADVLNEANQGRVLGIPEATVDALRAAEAFKTTQGWSLFRRPATLMRKETIELANIMRAAEDQKITARRILSGERLSGKSTLLLQGLSMAFLREWVVINLPEAQDIINAHTDYAPLPDSQPMQYTQDTYTANLLSQILKANPNLEKIKVTTSPTLPLALPKNATLKQLIELGIVNPEASWPVFTALWQELTQPGRPPIMLAIDGTAHMMKESDYLNAEVNPIHSFDLTIIRHFIDHLSGAKSLPNGGVVLAATSQSNAPATPALDFSIQVAEARQVDPNALPRWNPYKSIDPRVMEALRDLHKPTTKDGVERLEVIKVGRLSKDEARSIMEYYAESGMLRAKVDDGFVTEKWSLAGMGNIGELERASGLGFIGAGTDTSTLLSDLQAAAKLIYDAKIKTGNGVMPIGIGFINWGANLSSAITLIEQYKPAAAWFFAPASISSLCDWTSQTRKVSPQTKIWVQIGSVQEASQILLAARPDVLVVQGTDAGGHGLVRGASLMTLFPEVSDKVHCTCREERIPPPILVAAGGIVEARGAAAAFALGASGIVLGTRLLASPEANISNGYKDEIIRASDGGQSTVRTKVYDNLRGTTGWAATHNARGVINKSYVDAMAGMDEKENKKLYEEEMKKGEAGWGPAARMTTYAGSGVGLVKEIKPAGNIVREVREGSRAVLHMLGSSIFAGKL